jgi:hypothetical protein
MTQTIVPFVIDTYNSRGQIINREVETRVFDFEIPESSKTYYETLIASIGNAYDKVLAGVDVDHNLNIIRDDVNALNLWSGLRYIDENGEQQLKPLNNTAKDAYNPALALPAGYHVTDTTISQALTSTMNRQMAEQLERLNRLLASFGFNSDVLAPSSTTKSDNTSLLSALRSLSSIKTDLHGEQVSQFTAALVAAIEAAESARLIGNAQTGAQSIQEVLMVDYISRGNEMLYNQMAGLKTAINANQSALAYLNSLQDLLNKKDPQKFIMDLSKVSSIYTDSTGVTKWLTPTELAAKTDNYTDFEKQFGNDLKTIAFFKTDVELQTYLQNTPEGVSTLFQQAFTDIGADPTTYIHQIITYLNSLISDIKTAAGDNASTQIVQSLTTILADFKALNTSGKIWDWVQDLGSTTSTAGDYQTHVTNAIVAAQSFNDTQREELQRVMFVFEEFYKSATSLLSSISQLIVKMADHISR